MRYVRGCFGDNKEALVAEWGDAKSRPVEGRGVLTQENAVLVRGLRMCMYVCMYVCVCMYVQIWAVLVNNCDACEKTSSGCCF
jgi:hypothetical protein